ncbi:FkbM family methyltransferase [Streptomyces cavourensis]|uniref:FkbM family methyltransferase n=1 Tax=Streptomyces cavourensis TaxID=67258 RepID=UPI00227887AF|nr:FkbM family methyltransferase [Streptomyces cavourensis]WAE69119.1 FkbM family methyltransferase [Streptomyces cavourensis]
MRKIFVDCGTNLGIVLKRFMHELPDHDFYAFEPNPTLLPSIMANVEQAQHSGLVEVTPSAVWTEDGTIDLFLGHHESSTVMPGKRVPPVYDQQIDYSSPVAVPAVDFSAWLRRTATSEDHVVVKMDIEGAEYPVLRKLLADGTIDLVSVLYVEWHHDRFPAMSQAEHDEVAAAVSARVDVRHWD